MRRVDLRLILALLSSALLAGCAAPLLGSSVASAGYGVAHGPLGNVFGSSSSAETAQGRDPRQVKLQGVLNAVQVGQDAAPVLHAMGETPKEKSGNPQGYTCYEFPAVYSATAAAVIVARDGKVVFFGNSHCVTEMQEANFQAGGKYAVPGGQPASGSNPISTGNSTPAVNPAPSDSPTPGDSPSSRGSSSPANSSGSADSSNPTDSPSSAGSSSPADSPVSAGDSTPAASHASGAPDAGTDTSGHGAGAQPEDDKHGTDSGNETAAGSSSGR
ncbi:hypothetical protein KVP10_16615 [Candidimonas humi]|uniref:Uncharacterized protein n=1 Tax=Candidimonas humi TaxID=683355 RepID=A0ABV8P0Z9_9BURK|nr:hypothetical protein [Candidimonas humi]MBV6306516.1 hypothetical protein [Candidimonas humi]